MTDRYSDLNLNWHPPIGVEVIEGWGHSARIEPQYGAEYLWRWTASYGHEISSGFANTAGDAKEAAERWLKSQRDRK